MNTVEARHYKTINSLQRTIRRIVGNLTNPFLKKDLTRQPGDGLERLENLALQGYGSLILLNHFSKGEPPRAIAAVSENPVLGNRSILSPVGIHQHKRWYDLAGLLIGFNVSPITIEDTVEYVEQHPEKEPRYRHALTREGMSTLLSNYFNRGVNILDNGGVVILFPQGGRRAYLESVTTATGTLINRTNRAKVDRFAVMFMGVGIEGVENYTNEAIAGSINLGKIYKFIMGRTLTKEEFIQEAAERGLDMNQFALEELKLLVPPSYLPAKIS